jgi:hypothetical protein
VTVKSIRTPSTRITWEQFARAVKLLVALAWGTLELWQWGARPSSLAFIGTILVGTEGTQLWLKLRTAVAE